MMMREQEQVEESMTSPLFKDREVIVIHYMSTPMADELLSKYPDNSAFDFDYTQSSIWSPLVPRVRSLSCSPEMERKLEFESDLPVCKVVDKSPLKKFKKKVCAFGVKLNSGLKKKRKSLMGFGICGSDFPDQFSKSSSSTSKKGWNKVLKMASKQFKKKRDHSHHHHHPISNYVTLSDYMQLKKYEL